MELFIFLFGIPISRDKFPINRNKLCTIFAQSQVRVAFFINASIAFTFCLTQIKLNLGVEIYKKITDNWHPIILI